MLRASLATALLSAFALNAAAHHSFSATYDPSQTIELKGTVLEVKLKSPHSLVRLEVLNEQGVAEEWRIEGHSVPHLRRSGWERDSLKPGDALTVTAHPNRKPGSHLVFSDHMVTADGTVLGAGRARYATPERAAEGVRPLVGKWNPDRSFWADSRAEQPPLPLTPAALSIWQTYDKRLSPAKICTPNNVPSILYPPYLLEIRVEEDKVVLRHEVWNVTREIPLGSEPAAVEPTGEFGRASARFENETLVIESSGYPASKWGLGMAAMDGGRGDIPSSTGKRVTERYSVAGDSGRLVVQYTLEDPVFLQEAATRHIEFDRVPGDTPIYPFECDMASAAQYDQ